MQDDYFLEIFFHFVEETFADGYFLFVVFY